jgi:hypothetical protein
MSESSKDQTILQLMEILESLKEEIKRKSLLIAEMEKPKVPIRPQCKAIALSQVTAPKADPIEFLEPINQYNVSNETKIKVDKAVDMVLKYAKQELRFR